ncbi:class 1 fructose-bisphosphatase [Chitinibacteraceae bacterium HSL-7]
MTRLNGWLSAQVLAPGLQQTLLALAAASIDVGHAVRRSALDGLSGATQATNVQGEVQQQLDVLANECFHQRLRACPAVAALASEEDDVATPLRDCAGAGELLVAFDPLDGSSNLAVNGPVGSIFSILPAPEGRLPGDSVFLQPGRAQLAAGYALYSAATMLVLSVGRGTHAFVLDDAAGEFVLATGNLHVSDDASELAINASNARHWQAPVRRYVDECFAGRDGVRQRDFNLRWVAAMVADMHRILVRGGVFLYPADTRTGGAEGKLRLLYEASPMAYLLAGAGGAASTGTADILDVVPERLHQRVPVLAGARNEVRRLTDYHLAGEA